MQAGSYVFDAGSLIGAVEVNVRVSKEPSWILVCRCCEAIEFMRFSILLEYGFKTSILVVNASTIRCSSDAGDFLGADSPNGSFWW